MIRLVVFASGAFAVPSLERLVKEPRLSIVRFYTRHAKKGGRGKKNTLYSAVHAWVIEKGIEDKIYQADEISSRDEKQNFSALKADMVCVVDYGVKLPEFFLRLPPKGCINLHPSLLPAWRGASPIPHAILSGNEQTGVSIIQLVKAMDAGPILEQKPVSIKQEDTSASLAEKLAEAGAELLLFYIRKVIAGHKTTQIIQKEDEASYAPKLHKADGEVNWQETAMDLTLRLRAFTPFPGLWFIHNGTRIRIIKAARITSEKGGVAGTISDIKEGIDIFCGRDIFRIYEAQREGKTALDAFSFLKGFPMKKGGKING